MAKEQKVANPKNEGSPPGAVNERQGYDLESHREVVGMSKPAEGAVGD
jgi:hypothetical protein